MTRQKYSLEIIKNEDGNTFLNYWDSAHGEDVSCEIIDNKLVLLSYDEDLDDVVPSKTINLSEFISLITKQ